MREADRQACAALALAPGSTFSAVHGFVPVEARDALLALEALFRSLGPIPLSVSDPSVGIAKISWWQQELHRVSETGTQHPIVRALRDSGALEQLDSDRFNGYLHALVEQLQEEPLPDTAALEQWLDRSAGEEAQLIAGLNSGPATPLRCAGNALRLLELMHSSLQQDAAQAWLPMDLVARHQYRDGQASSASRDALAADLAGLAQSWRARAPIDPAACNSPGAGLVALRDGVVGRRLEALKRQPGPWLDQGQRTSMGDVFSTWRLARQLGRAA